MVRKNYTDPDESVEYFKSLYKAIEENNIPVTKEEAKDIHLKLQKIIKDAKRLMTKFAGIETVD